MATAVLDKNEVFNDAHMAVMVRDGLPFAVFNQALKLLGLSKAEMAKAIHLPGSTMARRQAQGRLKMEESERLLRFVRLQARAEEVFHGTEQASRWLFAPNRALGGQSPFAFADTEPGAREVENVLGRIQHGVFS